jgi:hypothetical protein
MPPSNPPAPRTPDPKSVRTSKSNKQETTGILIRNRQIGGGEESYLAVFVLVAPEAATSDGTYWSCFLVTLGEQRASSEASRLAEAEGVVERAEGIDGLGLAVTRSHQSSRSGHHQWKARDSWERTLCGIKAVNRFLYRCRLRVIAAELHH